MDFRRARAAARGSGDRVVAASTVVDAPPSVVFAILCDPRQHPRIDGSGSVRRVVTGPARLAATGDRFAVSMRLFAVPYRIWNTVVEHQPDRRIAWRHFGAHRWRYELEQTVDGRTRVTETWDASRYRPAVFRVLALAGFPARNRRGIDGTLERLKAAAEADAG
ncbi:MAG TPA: SRPBCC family protein [Nocardioidaceae bacterium]|nr:SRPBCC family protein [Nocardioidaceae bacterium]